MEGTMNCLRKKRENESAHVAALKEKEELEDLVVLLEGRYVAEDYIS
jgi:hypothetical protein